ncbi:MAG: hypothetical protein ACKOZW_01070 [Cyanobium sp.]
MIINIATPPSNTVNARNTATVGPATAQASSAAAKAVSRSSRTGNQRGFGTIGGRLLSHADDSSRFFPPPGARGTHRTSTRVLRALLIAALVPAVPTAGWTAATPAPPPAEVCVLAPRVEAGANGRARARAPLARPTIFVREPLRQVRVQQGGRLLWQRQADPTNPLEGPIAWPLPPLRAGERLELLLQPSEAPPAAFATVEIQSVPTATLRRNEARLAALGRDPEGWRNAVKRALEEGDEALATALLFAFEGPSAPELDALRREAYLRSCP